MLSSDSLKRQIGSNRNKKGLFNSPLPACRKDCLQAGLESSKRCSKLCTICLPQSTQPDATFPDPSFGKGKEGVGKCRLFSFTSWKMLWGTQRTRNAWEQPAGIYQAHPSDPVPSCDVMAVWRKRGQWLLLELISERLFGCLCQPASLGAPRGGPALPRVPLRGCSQSWRPFVKATWASHLQAVSPNPSFPLCSFPSPFRCCCSSLRTAVFLSRPPRPPHVWVQLPRRPHPW